MKLLKNRTVLGVLCIAVSLLICFAVTPLVNAGLSQKTTIVRFVMDVTARCRQFPAIFVFPSPRQQEPTIMN